MKLIPSNRSGRTLERLGYHGLNALRDLSPQGYFRRRLPGLLADWTDYGVEALLPRLDYYFRLREPWAPAAFTSSVRDIPNSASRYYYDLKEHARYFPADFRISHEFGDVTWVPDTPSMVKSRPVGGDNQNSILLNLDKFRHFYFPRDPLPFREKRPAAVWRGNSHNPVRVALLQRYHGHPRMDVGDVGREPAVGLRASFLRPQEQMAFRYVLSVEGIDVATNLKWILNSNSLCLMPEPRFETWFMEGKLEAGRHYVAVRPDFEDLEAKIDYYEAHPAEAEEIIREASEWVREFRDPKKERLLSLLVLLRYFVGTGQMDADPDLRPLLPEAFLGGGPMSS